MAEQKACKEGGKGKKEVLSLVNPDLSGFWLAVTIGKENDWWHKSWGLGCQLLFLSCWVFGGTFPIWILLLLYLRWHITLLILVFLMSYSYVFEVGVWAWACRNLILPGAYWYEGGCTLCCEIPPKGCEETHSDDPGKQTPCLACIHPHGMFTQGLLFNTGFRLQALSDVKDPKILQSYVGRKWNDYTDVYGPRDFCVGMVADIVTKLPLFRHLVVKWTGCVRSASKESVLGAMSKGQSFGLLPGGFYEASFMIRNREQIYIKVE